jgi:hypothetical protein
MTRLGAPIDRFLSGADEWFRIPFSQRSGLMGLAHLALLICTSSHTVVYNVKQCLPILPKRVPPHDTTRPFLHGLTFLISVSVFERAK